VSECLLSIVLPQLLKKKGVPEDHIFVVAVTMSPDAAEMLRKYKGVKAISASIEAAITPDGMLVPGLGHFEGRYAE
jgi:uracil phosphoribosyltransferase